MYFGTVVFSGVSLNDFTYNQVVQDAQKYLNALGATDEDGNMLAEDGIWGPHMNAAFAKLYKAHGMPQPSALTADVVAQLRAWFQSPAPGGSKQPEVSTHGPVAPPPEPSDVGTAIGIAVGAGILVWLATR